MVDRFGLLLSALRVCIHNIGPPIQCIVRLHYCILNRNNRYARPHTWVQYDVPLLIPRNEEVGQETNDNPAQLVDNMF
jgi:hypothetical protein